MIRKCKMCRFAKTVKNKGEERSIECTNPKMSESMLVDVRLNKDCDRFKSALVLPDSGQYAEI